MTTDCVVTDSPYFKPGGMVFPKNKFCGLNTLRTGDADLRFYITTVQDG